MLVRAASAIKLPAMPRRELPRRALPRRALPRRALPRRALLRLAVEVGARAAEVGTRNPGFKLWVASRSHTATVLGPLP